MAPPPYGGVVGQQQLLIWKWVKPLSATGPGGVKEIIEGAKELQELQGEGLGGQEDETEGVPEGAQENELEHCKHFSMFLDKTGRKMLNKDTLSCSRKCINNI
ncbi:hypothetical protein ID866_8398 [Astraeus odoratus]|nr:hypothetical protein ID866_8398 [Astraeus odoratus]